MKVKSYEELIVWQKAMDLVSVVYQVTSLLPREELFGPSSQLKRAAVSVPSNIAEGQGRQYTKEFAHHLSIAYGSLLEVETQLLIAVRLGFVKDGDIRAALALTSEVGRMLNGLMKSLPIS